MTKMIPEMVWGATTTHTVETEETTYRCIDCLLGGVQTPLTQVYVVSGTMLCAGHAWQARTKELENAAT